MLDELVSLLDIFIVLLKQAIVVLPRFLQVLLELLLFSFVLLISFLLLLFLHQQIVPFVLLVMLQLLLLLLFLSHGCCQLDGFLCIQLTIFIDLFPFGHASLKEALAILAQFLNVVFHHVKVVPFDELSDLLQEADVDVVVLQLEALQCLVLLHRLGEHGS